MKLFNKVLASLLSCLCLACLVSCHSKRTPIDNLADLTEDVKENYENYTEKDWQTFAKEYELIEQELEQYQDQYSDDEKKEIGRLKGTCLGYVSKYYMKSFKKNMDDALKEAEGFSEVFSDAFDDSFDE